MYETPNTVLAAARELSLSPEDFRQVGPQKWKTIIRQIFESFANTYRTDVTWLWNHLKSSREAVQVNCSLKYLGSLVSPASAVWVLFEDWDATKNEGNYWLFEGTFGATLAVLNNMHGIEYYIVDRNFTWLIVENHHDILIGIGEPAESFIRGIAAQQSAPAGMER